MNYYLIGKDFELKESDVLKKRQKKKIKSLSFLAVDIGLYIIIPLLSALCIGLYLDHLLKTKNIFTLILIFFGFICTIYNLIRLTKLNARNKY